MYSIQLLLIYFQLRFIASDSIDFVWEKIRPFVCFFFTIWLFQSVLSKDFNLQTLTLLSVFTVKSEAIQNKLWCFHAIFSNIFEAWNAISGKVLSRSFVCLSLHFAWKKPLTNVVNNTIQHNNLLFAILKRQHVRSFVCFLARIWAF